jgi:hypothetical protein
LAPVPLAIWPKILERAADRPDCLFYLLTQVPAIATPSSVS